MASARAVKTHKTQTYRMRVLAVIDAHDQLLTGQQVAHLAGLTYKQAIFALNALNNTGKVVRTGRKFTARWGKVPDPNAETPLRALETAFRGFFR